jgi:glycosyltransferase involved in cell wall biosynthesis
VRQVQIQTTKTLSSGAMDNSCRMMLFDLSIRGHHPNYIQQLIRYWQAQKLAGALTIVVSPKFLEEHADVVDLARSGSQNTIHFVAIAPEEEAALKSRGSALKRFLRTFQEWQILSKYAVLSQATHCLIMYFDTCQLPLAFGSKSPCPFSGIYFRPTFHYGAFANHRLSWKDRLQQWREKLLLSRVLSHPQFRTLFCLDPFAVEYLQQRGESRVVRLADPVQVDQVSATPPALLRKTLEIDPGRQIFLFFGALTGRKGTHQLLDAIEKLPANLCQKLCLLLVGEIKATEKAAVEAKIAALCQARPVQIVRHYEFVPEQDVPGYFQLADVVLAPYQQHVGMSGILLLAAAAAKPVLSSDYGLMGEMVRRYDLGRVVDSTQPTEIAAGITQFLTAQNPVGDRAKMRSFAEQNSAEQYAKIIFQHLQAASEVASELASGVGSGA